MFFKLLDPVCLIFGWASVMSEHKHGFGFREDSDFDF